MENENVQDLAEPQNGYLRDLSEDDVYDRLKLVPEFNKNINSLESRIHATYGDKISSLERSLGNRTSVNIEALAKLEEYDPALHSLLSDILPKAINVQAMDENSLRPFLEPYHNYLQNNTNQGIVEAFYSSEELNSIVPPLENNNFAPKTDRHKSFVSWYESQGLGVQKALTKLGPHYVKAMKSFEAWEANKNKDRENIAENKNQRLSGGVQPSAQGKRHTSGPKNDDEAFEQGFNDVMKARKG